MRGWMKTLLTLSSLNIFQWKAWRKDDLSFLKAGDKAPRQRNQSFGHLRHIAVVPCLFCNILDLALKVEYSSKTLGGYYLESEVVAVYHNEALASMPAYSQCTPCDYMLPAESKFKTTSTLTLVSCGLSTFFFLMSPKQCALAFCHSNCSARYTVACHRARQGRSSELTLAARSGLISVSCRCAREKAFPFRFESTVALFWLTEADCRFSTMI